MKVSYKMAHEIKEVAELLWNGKTKKMFILLDKLKHKYNWSVNKTLHVFDLVYKQFSPCPYEYDEDYPDWRDFKNIYELQNYLWTDCCQYFMSTRELMVQKI